MRGLKKYVKRCFCVLMSVALIICLVGCANGGNNDKETVSDKTKINAINYNFEYTFMYPKWSWEGLDLSKTKYKSKEDFEKAILDYIKQIEEVTGLSDWISAYGSDIGNITFKVVFRESVENGAAASIEYGYVYGNALETTLSICYSMFESGMPILCHELCHFMLGNVFSRSIEEGFCDYLLRRIEGPGSKGFTLDINVYDMLIGYNEECIYKTCSEADIKAYELFKAQEMQKIGAAGITYPYGASGKQAKTWFGYSEAFVTYLIDNYGMNNFITFYRNAKSVSDYVMLDNRGYEAIVADWIVYYNSYEPTVHYEDYH